MRTAWPDGFFKYRRDNKTTDKQKIIDKVMKLLAVSESSNQEGEIQSAKKQAARLLAKHNLKISQHKMDENAFQEHQENKNRRVFAYESILTQEVARFCGVQLYQGMGGGRTAYFKYVGTYANLENYKYMMNIVLQQRARHWERYEGGATFTQWALGYAYGVHERVEELLAMRDSEIHEQGLVPMDEAKAADAWFRRRNRVTKESKSSGRASRAGYESGKQVQFHKGVDSTNETRQISA